MRIDRRDSLKLIAAGASAALVGLGAGTRPLYGAAAPADKTAGATQGAGFYKFKIGDIEAALVSDGSFLFAPPYPLFGANATKEKVDEALKAAFVSPEHVPAQVNTLLLRVGKEIVLIDSGCGNAFGPTTGKLLPNLAAAGVQPDEVTVVIVTHAHPDHVCGLHNSGKPVFRNARYFAHKDEIAFWTAPHVDLSRSTAPAEMKKGLVNEAVWAFKAMEGKLEPFENKKRIIEGIEIVAAPGHTPGHSGLLIASGDSQLLYVTDAAHHAAINFAHPDWHVAFDADPVEAAKSRRALLDRAAADRVLVSGAHLPFPAVGHVRAKDNAFEWVPAVWEWTE
jgi:glyoxylase-like metal-dependent hydrolase (beta-lactamase superfamily II)